MFNAYDFTFAGVPSSMYDLMIYDFDGTSQSDVAFGNQADISETRINQRIQPIHYGVNYHDDPLEFKLVFGAQHPLSRYDLENISMWLTGYQDYQWLTIEQPDLEHVQFRCLVTTLKPIASGWLPYAFQATITCDCPYAYGYPFEFSYAISGETEITFWNESTVHDYLKPTLTFVPDSGVTEVSIVNESDNDREFQITDMPSSDLVIVVDNTNGIITEETFNYNLYGGFNLNFFRLLPGANTLIVTGDGTLTISGRFLHNVAA